MNDTYYWYWLSKIEEVGTAATELLLRSFTSIEGIYRAEKEEYQKLDYLSEKMMNRLCEKTALEVLVKEYEELKQRGIFFLTKQEEAYPKRLLEIYEAPYFLYYRGKLPDPDKPAVAMIGARDCTSYGREIARSFAKELSDAGIQIISGLARGVDGYSHRGALEGKSETFGVIGSGVNRCYPKENYTLYEKMLLKGGIISEYPMNSNALAFHFPMRNRIIAGLSDGIFVIEARAKSGTLITVDRGLEQGKDIYAIPGRITDEFSIGCHHLIQNGAKLIMEPSDIVEELRIHYPGYFEEETDKNPITRQFKQIRKTLSKEEQTIYDLLSLEPKHTEILAYETKLPVQAVMEQLFLMELKGVIRQVSSQYYVAVI